MDAAGVHAVGVDVVGVHASVDAAAVDAAGAWAGTAGTTDMAGVVVVVVGDRAGAGEKSDSAAEGWRQRGMCAVQCWGGDDG